MSATKTPAAPPLKLKPLAQMTSLPESHNSVLESTKRSETKPTRTQSAGEPNDPVQAMRQLVASGHYTEGRAQLLAYLDKNPGQPTACALMSEIEYHYSHYDEALRYMNIAVAQRPSEHNWVRSKALILGALGDGAAVEAFREQFMQSMPDKFDGASQFASIELKIGNPQAALKTLAPFLDQSGVTPAIYAMGIAALTNLGQTETADRLLSTALKVFPGDLTILNATVHRMMQANENNNAYDIMQAIHTHHSAEQIPPDVTYNYAALLNVKKEWAQAAQQFLKVIDNHNAMRAVPSLFYLYDCLMHNSEWNAAAKVHKRAEQLEQVPTSSLFSPFLLAVHDFSPRLQNMVAKKKALTEYNHIERNVVMTHNRHTGKPLKLGFISSDFKAHATTHLMAEIFELLDKQRMDVHVYSYGSPDKSEARQRIIRSSKFFELYQEPSRLIAELINHHKIDILIDLKGWTSTARVDMMAYRPAPVQMHYIGYPGSVGADFIDWFIGDAYTCTNDNKDDFCESLLLLPGSYQINDRKRMLPPRPTRASVGLPEDAVVLAQFNQSYKITREAFDVWMQIMKARPQTVMWTLHCTKESEQNLRQYAQDSGVDPARIIFSPKATQYVHMARLQLADIAIDTYPCNSHTTASDALWCGVPIVTWSGHSFASRVAGGLLHAVSLPQLITDNARDYQQKIIELIDQPQTRAALRQHLESKRMQLRLFDSPAFTRDFEKGLETVWDLHLKGEKPKVVQLRKDNATHIGDSVMPVDVF